MTSAARNRRAASASAIPRRDEDLRGGVREPELRRPAARRRRSRRAGSRGGRRPAWRGTVRAGVDGTGGAAATKGEAAPAGGPDERGAARATPRRLDRARRAHAARSARSRRRHGGAAARGPGDARGGRGAEAGGDATARLPHGGHGTGLGAGAARPGRAGRRAKKSAAGEHGRRAEAPARSDARAARGRPQRQRTPLAVSTITNHRYGSAAACSIPRESTRV